MKTSRRNFLKGLSATLASVWCINGEVRVQCQKCGAYDEFIEGVCDHCGGPITDINKAVIEQETEELHERHWPLSCRECTLYTCDYDCPNHSPYFACRPIERIVAPDPNKIGRFIPIAEIKG